MRLTGTLRFLAGILAFVLLFACRRGDPRLAEAALKIELRSMRDAIDQYYADRQHYPERLADLVAAGYLRVLPVDPMTRRSDTWVVVHEQAPTGLAPGIIDVHSGSSMRSLGGQRFADW